MKRTSKTERIVSAESIARLAGKGADVSAYFTNKGKMMPPLDSTGVGSPSLDKLNETASENRETDFLPSHLRNPDRG